MGKGENSNNKKVNEVEKYWTNKEALDMASNFWLTLSKSIMGGIAIIETGNILNFELNFCNEELPFLLGYSLDEFTTRYAKNLCLIICPDDFKVVDREIKEAVKERRPFSAALRVINSNENYVWVHINANVIKTEEDKTYYLIVVTDYDKEKSNEERLNKLLCALKYRTEHDILTGLYNRNAFSSEAAALIRNNPYVEYLVCACDIEKFRVFNDLYGTSQGDKVLSVIGKRISAYIEEKKGIAARWNADVFTWIIPEHLFDTEELDRELHNEFEKLSINYNFIIKYGIYKVEDKSVAIELMCDYASLAIQAVKKKYFVKSAYYDYALRNALLKEREISINADIALKNKEFKVYFQPIYSISTNSIISAEALVRWQHPEKGLISPAEFIPIFEKSGFIISLDAYVREEVFAYIRKLLDDGKTIVPISINLSRLELFNPHLAENLSELSLKYGVSKNLIKLEITESIYAENMDIMSEAVEKLKKDGYTVLMDDFGSDYSSLNLLKNSKFDILKIDLKFLEDFDSNTKSGNILSSVVRMARWLDLPVIAEGVETESQMKFLKSIGCDYMQGFYFSKPLPADEFYNTFENSLMLKKITGADLNSEDFDKIFNSDILVNGLFNSLFGAIGICEYYDDTLELVKVNDAYYEVLNTNSDCFFSENRNIFDLIAPDEVDAYKETIKRAIETNEPVGITVNRRVTPDGLFKLFDVKLMHIGSAKERHMLFFTLSESTNKQQNTTGSYSDLFLNSLGGTYDEIYEINYKDNTSKLIYANKHNKIKIGTIKSLSHNIKYWLNFFVFDNDKNLFLSFLSRENVINTCFKGEKPLSIKVTLNIGGVLKPFKILISYLDYNKYLCCIEDISIIKESDMAAIDFRVDKQSSLSFVINFENNTVSYTLICQDGRTIQKTVDINNAENSEWNNFEALGKIRELIAGLKEKPDEYTLELEADLFREGNDKRIYRVTLKSLAGQNNKKVVKIVGYFDDIGKYRKLNLNSIDAEELLDSVINGDTNGLFRINCSDNHKIVYGNNSFFKSNGLNASRNLNYIEDIIYPKDKYRIEAILKSAVKAHIKEVKYETRVKCVDGKIKWKSVYGKFYYRKDRVIMDGIDYDITNIMEIERELEKQMGFYKMLIDESDMLIFEYDTEQRIMSYSLMQQNGKREYRVVKNYLEYLSESPKIHKDYIKSYIKALSEACVAPRDTEMELLADYDGKGYKWYRAYYKSLVDKRGKIYRIIGRAVNIEHEKNAEIRLELEKRYRDVMLGNSLFVWEIDVTENKFKLARQKEGTEKEFYPADEYLKFLDNRHLYHPEDMDTINEMSALNTTLAKHFNEGKKEFMFIYRILNRYGKWVWVELKIMLVADYSAKSIKGLVYVEVVDNAIKETKLLKRRAERDSLSSVYNRATTEEKITEAIAVSKNSTFAFFMLDIDNFKYVNDTYGHMAGDQLIKKISVILQNKFSNAVIGRLGGDEFAVFANCTGWSKSAMRAKANEILFEIRYIKLSDTTDITPTVSIGVSVISTDNSKANFETYFLRADEALYRAKNKGKNCIVIYGQED